MMRNQQSSSDHDNVLSDRIIKLLRDRIVLTERNELIEYLDQLIPEYKMPSASGAAVADKRLVYDWHEFLDFYGEDFIRNAYLCIFKREVDVSGLQSATHALNVEACSRVKLLGRLRYSDEGNRHAVEIKGLWLRYQLARLQKIPLLGRLLSLMLNLKFLSRPEIEVDSMNAGINKNKKKLTDVEAVVSGHFNSVVDRLAVSEEDSPRYSPQGRVSQVHDEAEDMLSNAGSQRESFESTSVLDFITQLPQAIRFLARIDTVFGKPKARDFSM